MTALRLLLVLLVLAGGCVTAEGAYRDAMDAETSGDYDRAVHLYATALRRDRDLANARGRLVVAARQAVRHHLTVAASADPVRAAEAWLAAEAVVAEAASAGVEAERPATFAADRDAALDAAAYALLADAAAAVDARDYPRAMATLDAVPRFRPSPARQAEARTTRADALVFWAEDERAAGRFRTALAHADAAAALGADVGDLHARILDEGAHLAVWLPATPDASGDYPEAWLRRLDETLDEAAQDRDPFLVSALSDDVRRLARSGTAPRSPLARAAWVAGRLDADFAVLVRLAAPVETVEVTARERVAARRRGSRDTTSYVRETVERRIVTTAEATVLRADRREPVCTETVAARGQDRQRRGVYDGDWRTLDLGASERALFDAAGPGRPGPDRAGQAALDDLAGDLAERLAERATACLARQIL